MSVKIYDFLSLFFRLILIYFIVFIWVRYYSQSVSLAIWITALITFFIEILFRIIAGKKTKLSKLKNEELKKIELYTNTFIFSDDKYCVNFFYNLAKLKHKAIKKKDFVLITHDNGEKIVLYPFFTMRTFSCDDLIFVLNKIKSVNANRLVLCVTKTDKECIKFASAVDIKVLILEKEDTYSKLLKFYNFYPEQKDLIVLKQPQKSKFKQLLVSSISRKRSKGYFISSIVLVISSLILPYNAYYLIFSTILLVLSLISLVSPIFIKKQLPEQII